MLAPIHPPDEPERLAALCRLLPLDTPPDDAGLVEAFDLAAPIAKPFDPMRLAREVHQLWETAP